MDQTLKVHMHLSASRVHRRSITFFLLSIFLLLPFSLNTLQWSPHQYVAL